MMTSRERMLVAIRNEQPDMVPVAPDISNMIPARLTGKSFIQIYLHNDPPLWRAYIEAVKHFGMDGWFIYGGLAFHQKSQAEVSQELTLDTPERKAVRTTYQTPAGALSSEVTYFSDSPAEVTEGLVKDIADDMPKLKCLWGEITGYDPGAAPEMRRELGELGAFGMSEGLPGFQGWFSLFDGGVEALTYAYYDRPDLIEELRQLTHGQILRRTQMILEEKPDFLLVGASGSITLQSPEIFRRLSLPTFKAMTAMAREAGVPSMLHSCGKEADLVRIAAEETDLNCINPLERSPMGDCDLRAIKQHYGRRLSLMGNLHTTDVMLRGTPQEVEAAARKCIDDAAEGGGFILSTGDQCGRDTPDENIFKMVEVARTYGRY